MGKRHPKDEETRVRRVHKPIIRRPILSALLLTLCAAAHGEEIHFSDSIPLATTGWSDSVSFPQFDPSWGILENVSIMLAGHIEGQAGFENLDSAPATVAMTFAGQVVLSLPDQTVAAVAQPMLQTLDSVTPFDGVLDFAGTSGKTYLDLVADDSVQLGLLPANFLPLFMGGGTIELPVAALGMSHGSGAGNLALQFQQSASADVDVTYIYTVPETGSVILLGFGLTWMAGRRGRRWPGHDR